MLAWVAKSSITTGSKPNFADINREVSIEHALGPRLDIDTIAHRQGVGLPLRMRSRMAGRYWRQSGKWSTRLHLQHGKLSRSGKTWGVVVPMLRHQVRGVAKGRTGLGRGGLIPWSFRGKTAATACDDGLALSMPMTRASEIAPCRYLPLVFIDLYPDRRDIEGIGRGALGSSWMAPVVGSFGAVLQFQLRFQKPACISAVPRSAHRRHFS